MPGKLKPPIVILCGAGLSAEPPSNLPTAFSLRDRIVGELSEITSSHPLRACQKAIEESEFPLEFLLEILVRRFGSQVLSCLEVLKSPIFNSSHAAIAELARGGLVRAILTVNFDELIERALDARGCVRGRDYAVHIGVPQVLAPSAPVPIVKLHGTISDLDSLVATLQQVGGSRQRSDAIRRFFEGLGGSTYVITGYRGADFDLQRGLASMIRYRTGIWNTLDTSGLHTPLLQMIQGNVLWQHRTGPSSHLLRDIVDEFALTAPVVPSSLGRAGAGSVTWHDSIDSTMRIKTITDITRHLGRLLETREVLVEYLGSTSGDGTLPLMLALAETELGLDRPSEAHRAIEGAWYALGQLQVMRQVVGQERIEVEIVLARASWLWQYGDRQLSIGMLEQLLDDIESGSAKATNHQTVRCLTHLAERCAATGGARRGLALAARAEGNAGTHLQLIGVCRRTSAACFLELGEISRAINLLEKAMPDLIADHNGQMIALGILTRCYLAKGQRNEARSVLDRYRAILGQTSHRVRAADLKALESAVG